MFVFRMCEHPSSMYNVTGLVHPDASTSIMFAADAPQVTRFCDSTNHNRNSPTKHNLICSRRSTMDIILQHSDFINRYIQAEKLDSII